MNNYSHKFPCVSVVMATNSIGNYFEKAINSVINSRNVDWELVIVFDAIPIPNLPYLLENKRIKCIQKSKATGLPEALNLGITNATHELIARLDSDDLMNEYRLSKQAKYLIDNPQISVLGSSVQVIDRSGNPLGVNFGISVKDCRTELIRKNVLVHSSVMFRKNQWSFTKGYNQTLRQMEDYELWLRLGLQGEIWNLKEILTSYRLHDNQMSLGSGYDLNYIVPVTKAKKALAQKIDMHPIRCIYFDLVWKSAQILRSLHLRKKFSIENETP